MENKSKKRILSNTTLANSYKIVIVFHQNQRLGEFPLHRPQNNEHSWIRVETRQAPKPSARRELHVCCNRGEGT